MMTGLVSFCHTTFMAIGGYTSALMVMRLGFSSWMGSIFAIIVTVIVATAFGLVVLRLKGTYFFLATYSFGELVMLIFTRWTNPFGGPAGLINIPSPDPIAIPGLLTLVFESKPSFFYLAFIITLVPMLIVYRLDKGRIGAIWTGIQQSEQLSQSLGINVTLYKIIAFTIGSAMAALAGSFHAHYFSHIHPKGFGFFLLMNYLIFVIVGGSKRFAGPVVGALLMTLLGEFLSLYETFVLYQSIVYGFVLILFIMFLPEGLISLPEKLVLWLPELKGRQFPRRMFHHLFRRN
jgi:branched-chain amino acid transport system permease protein